MDVLAIMHLILNPNDSVSFERVVKNVLSGVGDKSREKIQAYIGLNADQDFTKVGEIAGAFQTIISTGVTGKYLQILHTFHSVRSVNV
mgnify:CR=1 FL=1